MTDNICSEKTFRQIYFEHCEYLRNFLYYKSGDLQLAEDLMQDAFAKMWENCKTVTIAKSKSYVFTIGHNLLINKIKRNKLHFNFVQKKKQRQDNNDPQFLLEESEFKKRLIEAIDQLPENLRVVFLMSRVDNKKYREIAEELDLSVKAVEKRMHKALLQLRQIHKNI